MRRKHLFLSFALVLVMVPTYGSAQAAGAQWTVKHPPLTGSAETSFSGTVTLQNFLGSFDCGVDADTTLEAPSGGSLDGLSLDSCEPEPNGFWGSCEVTNTSTEGLPAGLQAGSEEIGIEGGVVLELVFDAQCEVERVAFELGDLTATPDNPAEIGELAFSGEAVLHMLGIEFSADAWGTLEADEPGEYGIE